jgi:hypothetical protein
VDRDSKIVDLKRSAWAIDTEKCKIGAPGPDDVETLNTHPNTQPDDVDTWEANTNMENAVFNNGTFISIHFGNTTWTDNGSEIFVDNMVLGKQHPGEDPVYEVMDIEPR